MVYFAFLSTSNVSICGVLTWPRNVIKDSYLCRGKFSCASQYIASSAMVTAASFSDTAFLTAFEKSDFLFSADRAFS